MSLWESRDACFYHAGFRGICGVPAIATPVQVTNTNGAYYYIAAPRCGLVMNVGLQSSTSLCILHIHLDATYLLFTAITVWHKAQYAEGKTEE